MDLTCGIHVSGPPIFSLLSSPPRSTVALRPPMSERKPPWVCAAVAPSPRASSTVRSAQASEREPPWACSAAAPPPTGAWEPPRACAAVRPPPRSGAVAGVLHRRLAAPPPTGAAAGGTGARELPRLCSAAAPSPDGRAGATAGARRRHRSPTGELRHLLRSRGCAVAATGVLRRRPVGMREPPRVSVGHTVGEGNERENRGEKRNARGEERQD